MQLPSNFLSQNITPHIQTIIEKNRSDFSKKILQNSGADNISYEQPSRQNWTLTKWDATYIFSAVNWKNKYSANFFDCSWLVWAGFSRKDWELISFFSHQDPMKFLYSYRTEFIQDLQYKFEELRDLSYDWKINIGAFWWDITGYELHDSNYTRSIMELRKHTRNILDKDLRILVWPNNICQNNTWWIWERSSHFFYDNKSSSLHSYKPTQVNEISNLSFSSWDVYDILSSMK